jgi:hypothetical protein
MQLLDLALADRTRFERGPRGPMGDHREPYAQSATDDRRRRQTRMANQKRNDCENGEKTGNASVYAQCRSVTRQVQSNPLRRNPVNQRLHSD